MVTVAVVVAAAAAAVGAAVANERVLRKDSKLEKLDSTKNTWPATMIMPQSCSEYWHCCLRGGRVDSSCYWPTRRKRDLTAMVDKDLQTR